MGTDKTVERLSLDYYKVIYLWLFLFRERGDVIMWDLIFNPVYNNIEKKDYNFCVFKMIPKYRLPRNQNSYKQLKAQYQYVKEVLKVLPHVIVLEEYTGSHNKIAHYCCIHGVKWFAYPTNVIRGHSCPECQKEKTILKNTKTTEEYIAELHNHFPHISPLEEYKGAMIKIEHYCSLCDYKWSVTPSCLLNTTYGCLKCYETNRIVYNKITEEQYKEKLSLISSSIILYGKYINSQTKTFHKCLVCNHIWEAYPNNLMRGHGCPNCSAIEAENRIRKPIKEYIAELESINSKLRPIEEYTQMTQSILHKCLSCGFIFNISPYYALKNGLCPKCDPKSKGERIIKNVLNTYNIDYIPQMKYSELTGVNGYPLSYDFYIPSKNVLVEFNGIQHERPVDYFGGEEYFKIQQEHDRRKAEYAKNNNIKLIIIPYTNMDDIEQILINNLNLKSVETVMVA